MTAVAAAVVAAAVGGEGERVSHPCLSRPNILLLAGDVHGLIEVS